MLNYRLVLAFVCLGSASGLAESPQLALEMEKAENNHVLVELPAINFTRLYNEVPLMKLSRLYSEIPSLNFTKIYSRFFSGGSNSTAKATTTTTVKPDIVEEPHTMDIAPPNLLYQLTPVLPPNPYAGVQNTNLMPLNAILGYAPQGRSNQLVNLQVPYSQAQNFFNGRSYGNGYNYAYPNYVPVYGAGMALQVLSPPFTPLANLYDYTNQNSPFVQQGYPENGYQLVNGLPQNLEPYLQWLQSQNQLQSQETDQNADHFDYYWAPDDYSSDFSSHFGRQLDEMPTKTKQKTKRRGSRRPTRTQLRRRSKKRQKQQQQGRSKRFNY